MRDDREELNVPAYTDDDLLVLATGEYADAYRAGAPLDALTWLRAHPECDPRALVEWLLYFHTIGADLPGIDDMPTEPLGESARAVMERIKRIQQSEMN